jgi:hypothetical protein
MPRQTHYRLAYGLGPIHDHHCQISLHGLSELAGLLYNNLGSLFIVSPGAC